MISNLKKGTCLALFAFQSLLMVAPKPTITHLLLFIFMLILDDIDLEDPGHKPKGNSMMSALNKKKLASKFQLLKG